MKSLFACLFLAVVTTAFAADADKAPERRYVFGAEVVRVVDGGTVTLNIDLGFHVWLHDETMRLEGVTAPNFKDGPAADAQKWRAALESLLEGHKLIIETKKDKTLNPPTKFFVTIWADDENVNEALKKAVK